MSLGDSMDVETSAETVALATALAEKDPKAALAKLALNSGAEADAAQSAAHV